jgi:Secretion system C-terminal sorting domain
MAKPLSILYLFLIYCGNMFAQNRSGDSWVFGGGGEACIAHFTYDTQRPVVQTLFDKQSPFFPNFLLDGGSNICDSATGKLLMVNTGFVLFDTTGNIMENGDNLAPKEAYDFNAYPCAPITQGSLILPKGSNGLYYVFCSTLTDSFFLKYNYVSHDLLQYHVVDMHANNGLGKVIEKNKVLLNKRTNKIGMMACRHANGYDWWLLKQASDWDSTTVYRFLVQSDTILGPYVQSWPDLKFDWWDNNGQSCFSKDGSKYAFTYGKSSQLFIADFNRCTGILSNVHIAKVPIDSTTHPFDATQGRLDSFITGVCFSANDSMVYVNRTYNIYQYEMYNANTSSNWYLVKHGEDTVLKYFEEYGHMYRGLDDRIYIGKYGSATNSNSVIDYPNKKGAACGFCRKCFRYNLPDKFTISPPNMPDFNLAALANGCDTSKPPLPKQAWLLYPNPAYTSIKLQVPNSAVGCSISINIYNLLGQVLQKQTYTINIKYEVEVPVNNLAAGVYIIKTAYNNSKFVGRFLKE